jgi:flagellar basal-body rod protein FlgB
VVAAIDTGVDFLRQVLALRGYRQQVLAADLANASTPGFKAVDLDFRQALGAAGRSTATPSELWLVDDPRHLPDPGAASPQAAIAVKYQTGNPVTLDGNSVDLGQAKVAAAENAVQYEAAATFTAQIIRMLTTAIGGAGQPTSGGG